MDSISEAQATDLEKLEVELNLARQARNQAEWEMRRLLTSQAYLAGDAVARAFARPGWDTVALLPRLLLAAARSFKHRAARLPGNSTFGGNELPRAKSAVVAPRGTASGSPRPRAMLFFCVNGAGLGHLTRGLALARRVRRLQPDLPLYFLTTSHALPLIARERIPAYYLPPKSAFGDSISTDAWNALLLWTMQPIADLHGPLALVYDGVFPYNGLTDAIRKLPITRASMVLRLRFKHGISRNVRARLRHFDEIILPGEAGEPSAPALAGLPCLPVAPILYLDREELLERGEARRQLGIAPDRKAVYLQLGAGNIDDTSAALRAVLDTCRNRADTTVVHAVSPIAQSAPDLGNEYPNVVTLTHYPNAKCFKAFDLAISACGYNSFVELMHFGVPTIFVPNQRTVTDDQVGRARAAEAVGAARVALAADEIPGLLTDLMDSGKTAPMRICAASLIPKNGALAVAEHLLSDSRIEEST